MRRTDIKKQFKTIAVNEKLKEEFDGVKEIINGSSETNDQCLFKLLKVFNEQKKKINHK